MEKSINKTGIKSAFNLSATFSLMILIVGIFLLPETASASPVSPDMLITLTNNARQENGLGALTYDPLLAKAAEAKANAIIASGKFEHNIDGNRFSAWVKEAGYGYSHVGENLAIDFETSEGIFDAWMDSESHNRNIMNIDFREIGIATVEGDYRGQKTTVVVQIFGTPLPSALDPQVQENDEKLLISAIKERSSKAFYILMTGADKISAVVVDHLSRLSGDFKSASVNRSLVFASFRLASMIFFTVSLLVFYIYSTIHIFSLVPAAKLEE